MVHIVALLVVITTTPPAAPTGNNSEAAPAVRRSARIAAKSAAERLSFVAHMQQQLLDIDPALQSATVPNNDKEASASPIWTAAQHTELTTLRSLNAYTETPLPPGRKLVGARWVYALKRDGNGNAITAKARYVAKGFTQRHGIDYMETHSSTPRAESLRLVWLLANQHGWPIDHIDFTAAYINAEIDTDIYCTPPPGFQRFLPDGTPLVWKLNKSLYGLKQSGRNWSNELRNKLTSYGYKRLLSEPCAYIKVSPAGLISLAINHVDDMSLTGDDTNTNADTKKHLSRDLPMKDMGAIQHFVGLRITRTATTLKVDQEAYINSIIADNYMDCSEAKLTPPLELHTLSPRPSEDPADPRLGNVYSSLLGAIGYAAVMTRPDISYHHSYLSRFSNNPGEEHMKQLKNLLRYLKATAARGLTFRRSTETLQLTCYADSDYGSTVYDRRSICGFAVFLGTYLGAAFSWASKNQETVAQSTCEAEYMALALACREAVFLKQLLLELHQPAGQ